MQFFGTAAAVVSLHFCRWCVFRPQSPFIAPSNFLPFYWPLHFPRSLRFCNIVDRTDLIFIPSNLQLKFIPLVLIVRLAEIWQDKVTIVRKIAGCVRRGRRKLAPKLRFLGEGVMYACLRVRSSRKCLKRGGAILHAEKYVIDYAFDCAVWPSCYRGADFDVVRRFCTCFTRKLYETFV